MKTPVLSLLLLVLLALSSGVRAGSSETEDFQEMVADVMEADQEVAELEATEAEVEGQDVEAEHAALTAELQADAAHEFEWETQDEVEADAAEESAEAAADMSAAEHEVEQVEHEEEEEEEEEGEDESSFLSEAEHADADADSDAESDAEAGTEVVVAGKALLEFEEDNSDEAADDAEDAEATAEEKAMDQARFKSKPVQYDEAQAKEALVYAQIAYFEAAPAQCAAKLGHSKLRVHHTVTGEMNDGASVFGMTAVDASKQRLVVAFNGNVEPKELTAQLMRGKPLKLKSLCKSCKTHRYYAEAYRKICPEITASVRMLLKRPANRKFEVWITGHGMGGALASMCGYELEMARVFIPENKRVFVTFGQPRVGNAHWARKFAQMFPAAIRVTHGDDPFPHVPPCYVNPAAKGTPDEQTCYELKDRKKKLWAFHNPTQVWYPNVMPAFDDKSKGEFKVCNGLNWGEDPACRHSPLGVSIDDQRNYFGVDVSSHCANLIDPPAGQPDSDLELVDDY